MNKSIIFILIQVGLLLGMGLGAEIPRSSLIDWDWQTLGWWWISIALALLTIVLVWPNRQIKIYAWVILFCFAGISWSIIYRQGRDPGTLPYGQTVVVTGQVVNFPEILGTKQKFYIETAAWGKPTRILVETGREPRYRRGDKVTLAGKLNAPRITDDFNQARFLEGKEVFGVIAYPKELELVQPARGFWAWLGELRNNLATVFGKVLPEPSASLAAGLSIGIDPSVDKNLSAALKVTNLTHLAAVSGQNLAFAIFILYYFMRRYWLKAAIVVSLGLLGLYAVLTGAEASVVRAAIMGAIVLVSPLFGRPADPVRLLVLAATIINLANPLSLTRDIGFELSFLALSGIILLEPLLTRRLSFLPNWLASGLAVVLSATLAVLPIQVFIFNTMSTVGPLANLVVAPFVPIAMGGALITGLIGLISLPISQVLAWIIFVPLEIIHWVAIKFSALPMASITISVSSNLTWLLLGLELVIFMVLVRARLIRRHQPLR